MSKLKIPSIRPRLAFDKYRSVKAVSKSDLDLFLDCPAKFRAWEIGALNRESSDAMSFGTMLHSLVLSNRADWHVKPDGMTFASKEGKEWRDSHADKPIVSAADEAILRATARAINRHPHASRVLVGRAEVSMFGLHAETGITLKGRADILEAGHGDGLSWITDLKTTRRADNKSCARAIAQYGYHRQAWMYRELARQNGINAPAFYFVFVQAGDVPLINVKRLSEQAIELGGLEIGRALRQLKQCRESGIWPDYSGSGDIGTVDLPTYCYTDTTGMAVFPEQEMSPDELED
jgi:hypothetical protein